MATTSDIKNGLVIKLNGELYSIVEFQHVKPGKGSAFVRSKIRHIETGKVFQHTFNAGQKIDIQRVERRSYQFLYKEDTNYHFMNNETFEQTFIDESLINAPQFLKEGQNIDILVHDETETPLVAELPPYVELTVTYTEPGEKGNTATNTMKEATLETGANIKVPLFINEGELLKIDTRNGAYAERVKNK
ncbi:MAG: elongation factor P [Bacteroidales bacterium]|nr:elongation factor P [Bacteroidales bacterium]MCF8336607.1 elongation factor P [Bacteroidales bacterium]